MGDRTSLLEALQALHLFVVVGKVYRAAKSEADQFYFGSNTWRHLEPFCVPLRYRSLGYGDELLSSPGPYHCEFRSEETGLALFELGVSHRLGTYLFANACHNARDIRPYYSALSGKASQGRDWERQHYIRV